MNCACDACQFEVSAPGATCPFCAEHCFRAATFNGAPMPLRLAREARDAAHAQFGASRPRASFNDRQREVLDGLIDVGRPYAKRVTEMAFDAVLKKVGEKLGIK